MTQSDRILEFLDGDLAAADEQQLFEGMSADAELRNELRNHVQISQAVGADREAFAPPADVERRLLGGLGLFPAAAGSSAVGGALAGSGAGAGLLSFAALKGGVVPMLLGFVLGGLLVGGGLWLATDEDRTIADGVRAGMYTATTGGSDRTGDTEIGRAGATDQFNRTDDAMISGRSDGPADGRGTGLLSDAESTTTTSRSTETTTSSARSAAAPAVRTRIVYRDRPVYIDRGATEASTTVTTTSSNAQFDDNVLGGDDLIAANGNGISNDGPPTSVTQADPAIPNAAAARSATETVDIIEPRGDAEVIEIEPDPAARIRRLDVPLLPPAGAEQDGSNLTFELRKGLVVSPVIANNAREVSNDFVTNFFAEEIVGGLRYGDIGSPSVGIEVGRERYSQTFYYNRTDSVVIEQRPLVTWAGITGRLPLEAFGLPIEIGGTLGASGQGGPMARGLVAVDILTVIAPSAAQGPLRIPLSAEASSLVYRFEDQYLVSGNWGLNIGAEFRLGF